MRAPSRLSPLAHAKRLLIAIALCIAAPACGAGAPLLHPAHVLRPGFVSAGAGVSGQLLLLPARTANAPLAAGFSPSAYDKDLEDLAVAPGIAPWVAGRVGIVGSNEGGLTYTGRSVRVDGRHAFSLGTAALSVGLGASALLLKRPGQSADLTGVGFDVPVLLGVRSRNDIYALWIGPRAGFELLRAVLPNPFGAASPSPGPTLTGEHFQIGGVIGVRAGFRHVHVAVEGGFAYHRADGEVAFDETVQKIALEQASIAPGGALVLTF